jgi:hypothetical protein
MDRKRMCTETEQYSVRIKRDILICGWTGGWITGYLTTRYKLYRAYLATTESQDCVAFE